MNHEMISPAFLVLVMDTFVFLVHLLALFGESKYRLIGRLFPHFHSMNNQGRDVWMLLAMNAHIFWYFCRELEKLTRLCNERTKTLLFFLLKIENKQNSTKGSYLITFLPA